MKTATNEFDELFAQISFDRIDQLASTIAEKNAMKSRTKVKQNAPTQADLNDSLLQAVKVLDAPANDQNGKPMFERLGAIVRVMHDSLRELGYDRTLSDVAVQISEAQDRLAYVATLTEQAANKVLNAIDLGMPAQELLATQAADMDTRWALLFDGKLSLDEFRALAGDSQQFAAAVALATESEKARLLEIMMAQDFQDITGQLIKKIVTITKTVEMELAQLLRDNAPPEMRAALEAEEKLVLLNGPSLPSVALEQDGVDDLLDSLGF
ncbi:hypothetical protein BH11PSE11_BH11PSE11_00060 [soil metagenome]